MTVQGKRVKKGPAAKKRRSVPGWRRASPRLSRGDYAAIGTLAEMYILYGGGIVDHHDVVNTADPIAEVAKNYFDGDARTGDPTTPEAAYAELRDRLRSGRGRPGGGRVLKFERKAKPPVKTVSSGRPSDEDIRRLLAMSEEVNKRAMAFIERAERHVKAAAADRPQ